MTEPVSSSKRVLVTGLTGFTGRYVAAELMAAGFAVHGMGERPSTLPDYTQASLSDRTALQRLVASIQPQAVVHLAGMAFVGSADPAAFYTVNTLGTRNLLEALAAESTEVECILLASSANVYGNATEGMLDESDRLSPANDYAVSKLAMEYMARLWADRLPIVITRPFNYTGVGQSDAFLLPKIVRHFQRQARRIELGNCAVFRDFTDVRAVAFAYRRLLETRPVGQVINICSGQGYSVQGVLDIMAQIAGYAIEVQVNPAFVRTSEVRSLLGSAERLRQIIGAWDPLPLPETLVWMYHAPLQ
jgi:GDP-6-deoxy-D-talose 4-dehydrogenase